MAQHTDDRLLTPQEAADYLGMPVDTLRLWRYRGTGPAYARVGRHCRYRRESLDAWITTQTVDPAATSATSSTGDRYARLRRGQGAA